MASVLSRLYGGEDGDPTKMRAAELEAFRSRTMDALGSVAIHKTVAKNLVDAYKRAPKR
jgi:hypothetical protein